MILSRTLRCLTHQRLATAVTAQRTLFASAPSESSETSEQQPRSVFIAADTDIKKKAGWIAHLLRKRQDFEDVSIALRATGTSAVNKATKTLHVARRFLKETPGSGVAFRVNHDQGTDKNRISRLVFGVSATDHYVFDENKAVEEDMEEVWVPSRGSGRAVGGRISRALQAAEKAKIIAIGPRAVGLSVLGITWARRMLHKEGLDMIAIPHMTNITLKDEKTATGLHFYVIRTEHRHLEWLDPEEEFDDDGEGSVVKDLKEDST